MSNTYQQSLSFIQNHIDYSRTRQENLSAENFNLQRMKDLMAVLDNPHLKYKTIHIAGTKGKGSVSAMIASTLQQSGKKTGLYTSPHLQDFRERIQVNQEIISQGAFTKIVSNLKPIVEKIPGITAYEIQTALAFCYFAQENIDCAVIEVGLGGRLDSTNIVKPVLSIITSISLDHTSILGNTLEEISAEKAGIIKKGIPVVIAPQQPKSKATIVKVCKNLKSPILDSSNLYTIQNKTFLNNQQSFEIYVKEKNLTIPITNSLLGTHQIENAQTAFTALWELKSAGWNINIENIKSGFVNTNWPGRFEILQKHPLIILDGAHNADSAKRLMESINLYFPNRPISLIFGASADKDIDGMFNEILPLIHIGIGVQSQHPRAISIEKLREKASAYPIAWKSAPSVARSIRLAKKNITPQSIILITGSLYTVGEFRTYLLQE